VSEPVFDFDEMFDADYLYFYGPLLADVADADTDAVWRMLDVAAGVELLDLACGHGRIANRLAVRGARVTGLDATPGFLDQARADAVRAGVEVTYVQGDMRSLPWPDESFDRVLSWFTSFGYFADDDNHRVLREACRVLRPGGQLLMEMNNLTELLPRWVPAAVVERDGDLCIDRAQFDPTTGRATTERVVVRDGRTRRFTFSVRMFIAAELADWLRETGFETIDFVDRHGDPLTGASRRMIALARRRAA
jgi:ubiquinone/menaquinone biosynthesis C-methylase UbiE